MEDQPTAQLTSLSAPPHPRPTPPLGNRDPPPPAAAMTRAQDIRMANWIGDGVDLTDIRSSPFISRNHTKPFKFKFNGPTRHSLRKPFFLFPLHTNPTLILRPKTPTLHLIPLSPPHLIPRRAKVHGAFSRREAVERLIGQGN